MLIWIEGEQAAIRLPAAWSLTRESHASFKLTRERVRDEISSRLPLFAFYRALLRWLFVDPTSEPPVHEGVEVLLTD